MSAKYGTTKTDVAIAVLWLLGWSYSQAITLLEMPEETYAKRRNMLGANGSWRYSPQLHLAGILAREGVRAIPHVLATAHMVRPVVEVAGEFTAFEELAQPSER